MNTNSIEFQVQGSEPNPYTVRFDLHGEKLTASCSCRAGLMGNLCKHRLNLLNGSQVSVVSPNTDQIAMIQSWVTNSSACKELQQIEVLEFEKKAIEDKLKNAKKRLIKELS